MSGGAGALCDAGSWPLPTFNTLDSVLPIPLVCVWGGGVSDLCSLRKLPGSFDVLPYVRIMDLSIFFCEAHMY